MRRFWPPTDDAELEAYRMAEIKSTIRCALITLGLVGFVKLACVAFLA